MEKFTDTKADYSKISKELQVAAFNEYENPKAVIEVAFENLCYSKLFKYISESGRKPSRELVEYFLKNQEVACEFATTISKKDKLEKVFEILEKLYAASPQDFAEFANLACAIAVVFDAEPPKDWPHSQVGEKILKRDLGDALSAFKMRIDTRKRGKALLQTEKLSIDELKYLVASCASQNDRDWVFKTVNFTVNTVPKLYPSIKYSYGRLNAKLFNWNESDYNLKTIKQTGGICVDQAYYTAECAKIKGLPAFIFTGAGGDGFHAWTAYMLKSGKWNFDVGRYEGARFVTGHTINPQTWELASDHELNAMRESFRSNQKYFVNNVHTFFAKEYLSESKFTQAQASAEKAVASDQRNAETWNILIKTASLQNLEQAKIVSIYQRAIKAFGRYPDIEADYRRRLIELTQNSDATFARKISAQMIAKTKSQRPDIAMEFARMRIEANIKSDNLDKISGEYKLLLGMFKTDSANALTGITIPILNKLISSGKVEKCKLILTATRQVLKPKKDSPLESVIASIETQVTAIESKLKK